MNDASLLTNAITHQLYATALKATGRPVEKRDRGAVSLEQVLWFAASGVSVAVIASILWSKIKTESEKPLSVPVAP
jgi:hypothetical protein